MIDLILQPIVKQTSTYIKDSQQILQKYSNVTLDDTNLFLYTCDIEALYTNIDKNISSNLITEEIKQNLDPSFITPFGFHTLLKLIFENNIFQYDKKFFV